MSVKAEIGFTRNLSAEERRLMQGLCDALQQFADKQYQRRMWDCFDSLKNFLTADNLGNVLAGISISVRLVICRR